MTPEFKELIEYCKTELTLLNFDEESEFYKRTMAYIEEIYTMTNGDKHFMKILINNLHRLIDKKPLSFIDETGLVEEKDSKIKRHNRCSSVWVDKNGKFYDDQAVKFNDDMGNELYVYQGTSGSRKEITFPYFPDVTSHPYKFK
jgi:hypothetical protein